MELLFNGNVPENVDGLVTDISGRIVSEGRYSPAAGTIALDLSMCENGTYIIIIRDEKKQVTKRVIIQK